MSDYVVWVLIAAAPGVVALVLLSRRMRAREEHDAQLQEARELSRSAIDSELDAIRGRLAEMDRGRRQEQAEMAQLREQGAHLREEVASLKEWIAALFDQLRDAGLTPVPAPSKMVVAPAAAVATGVTAIQQKIIKHFSLEELDDLVFQLGVDGETVWSSAATLRTRARALVRFAVRHERLNELVELCEELRPSIDWK